MDVTRAGDELLSHFDAAMGCKPAFARHCIRTHGIGCVLRWAAAFAVLFFAASVLIEFAYCLAAEHALARAARAGALEATLPRATQQSIASVVQRRLAAYPAIAPQLRLVIESNGQIIRGALRPQEGDHLSVALAVSNQAVVPGWLNILKFWGGARRIEVRVERRMPGRVLHSD